MFPLTMFYDEIKGKIEKLVDFVDDQVENIEDSIEKSLTHNNKIIDDFNEKLRMDGRIGRIFVNDRGQLSNDFADFDTIRNCETYKSILNTLEENQARILKHQKLASQIENDKTRLEFGIISTYRVKLSIFLFCFEAIFGMILIPLVTGYLLNLIAILKILFAFLELSGLRNWQRNKVLANLIIHLMEPLVWLIYTGYLLMTVDNYLTILPILIQCIWLSRFFLSLRYPMQIWEQYSDMKKSRPIIPNFGAFPA